MIPFPHLRSLAFAAASSGVRRDCVVYASAFENCDSDANSDWKSDAMS